MAKLKLRQERGGLAGQDAKTALLFLEMQWHDESRSKGLTRSCFDALVRAALHDSSPSDMRDRSQVIAMVGRFLPRHSAGTIVPYVDAALKRLSSKLEFGHFMPRNKPYQSRC